MAQKMESNISGLEENETSQNQQRRQCTKTTHAQKCQRLGSSSAQVETEKGQHAVLFVQDHVKHPSYSSLYTTLPRNWLH